ncbi:PhoH family protein [Ferrovum sp.]|uniref:PhoH family protein n=1 Tax=Ferrovum sp. TaxID=2609467 RepID=UPI002631F4F5|nr:PhoH family protein [Ferrovum sp.]
MRNRAEVRTKQSTRRKNQTTHEDHIDPIETAPEKYRVAREPLTPATEAQKRYLNAIKHHTLTFADGPAGTGKTFVCTAYAASLLEEKRIERIIITRPAVEAGESLGFLPGELEDKFAPYLWPFKDVLNERLGKSFVEYLIKCGRIEAVPLAYIRGRTFRDAFVILDEAQNTSPKQMQMFLTRIGQNCKVVVNGDIAQCDIVGDNGLRDAIGRLSHLSSVRHVRFSVDDIVRSDLVGDIVRAYSV